MTLIRSTKGILRGRQKQSYTLLLCALIAVWSRSKKVFDWGKYKGWIFKQQFTKGRFEDLGEEEVRSAYLDARLRVFNKDEDFPILGELEYLNKLSNSVKVMTDKEEIFKAQKAIDQLQSDNDDGGEESGV